MSLRNGTNVGALFNHRRPAAAVSRSGPVFCLPVFSGRSPLGFLPERMCSRTCTDAHFILLYCLILFLVNNVFRVEQLLRSLGQRFFQIIAVQRDNLRIFM